MHSKSANCMLYILIISFFLDISYGQLAAQIVSYKNPELVGYLYDPQLSPLQDILAFERQKNNRRELVFVNQVTGDIQKLTYTGEVKQDTDAAWFDLGSEDHDLKHLLGYTIHLDWRPVVDAKGRQWFAFVSSGTHKQSDIYLSYIDEHGKLGRMFNLIDDKFVDLYPRWSPDGNRLVFVSGRSGMGDLYIIDNLRPGIQQEVFVQPVTLRRLTQNIFEDTYPAWSPDGRYIAYTEKRKGGIYGISLIDMQRFSAEENKFPQVIQFPKDPQDKQRNETNPTWSPDQSDLIAYYSSRVGQAKNQIDIGVFRMIKDRTNTRITGAVRPSGTPNSYLAEDVVPNQNRGPTWTTKTAGNPVIYVKRDESRFNPVHQAMVERWLNNQNDPPFDTEMKIIGTHMNREPTFFATPTGFVIVYVSQYGEKGFMLNIYRREKKPQALILLPYDRSKAVAQKKAIMFPGLAQLYKGQKTKGYALLGAEAVSLLSYIVFFAKNKNANDDAEARQIKYNNAKDPKEIQQWYSAWQSSQDDAISAKNKAVFFGVTALAVWVYNFFDARNGFPVTVKQPIRPVQPSPVRLGLGMRKNPAALFVRTEVAF